MLGVDPGLHAGWSLWRGDALVESGACGGDSPAEVAGILTRTGAGLVVVEQQMPGMPGGRRAGFRSLRTLIERAATWTVLARARGAQVAQVYPATWRAYSRVGRSGMDGVMGAARALAGRDVTGDEAAAILIGLWAVGQRPLGA